MVTVSFDISVYVDICSWRGEQCEDRRVSRRAVRVILHNIGLVSQSNSNEVRMVCCGRKNNPRDDEQICEVLFCSTIVCKLKRRTEQ